MDRNTKRRWAFEDVLVPFATDSIANRIETQTCDEYREHMRVTTRGHTEAWAMKSYLRCGQVLSDGRSCDDDPQCFAEGEWQNGAALRYGRDRLGSITDLVDGASGAVEADYAYDPWGNVTSATDTAQASFGYAGMFADANTGLNLTLYRAYNPTQYRWLSRDPLGESTSPNLYFYANNDPTIEACINSELFVETSVHEIRC